MVVRSNEVLPGAMELAESIDRLTIDGQPLFGDITLKEPKWISTGGHLFPPRAKKQDGVVMIDLFTTSKYQRLIATPIRTLALSVVYDLVEEFLHTDRSP